MKKAKMCLFIAVMLTLVCLAEAKDFAIRNQSDEAFFFINGSTGNVGIGTTDPTSKLHVDGTANITGLCVAEDSLITLADKTKKKITEIKSGDYVSSLDEETGKIVSNEVMALLDMGVKPVFNLTTKTGRSIKTTGNHPYLTLKEDDIAEWIKVAELNVGDRVAVPVNEKDYITQLPNNISKATEGVITLSGKAFFSPLSPERILQSNLRDKATNDTSFKCGELSFASSTLSSNLSEEIKFISFFKNEKISDISSFESLLFANNLSILLPISKNKNSGEINSNKPTILFIINTSNGLPFACKEENTVLVSTTTNINDHFLDFNNLFVNETPTSSESPSTSSSVNLLFDTILLSLINSSNSSFSLFSTTICQFIGDTDSNSFNSSGTLTITSAICSSPESNNKNNYIKSSILKTRFLTKTLYIKLIISLPQRTPKIASQFNIAPNHQLSGNIGTEAGDIFFDEIISIEYVGEEHVYDLMIENTHNFIANDIIAHNTYLNNTLNVVNGNVGIGTSSPQTELHVIGSANITGTVYAHNFSGNSNISFLNASGDEIVRFTDAGRVGIGTKSPSSALHVIGNTNVSQNLTVEGQCVAGDTLLSMADGAVKKIIDVEAGDFVLSLNEETRKIEPRRINGLLDMGIKPVFNLTTKSGRSIKTTGNHPYLVNFGNALNPKGVRVNNLPLNSEVLTELNKFNKEDNTVLISGGLILMNIIPEYFSGENSRILPKCLSNDNITLPSVLACSAINSSSDLSGSKKAFFALNPSFSNNLTTFQGMFSSHRSLGSLWEDDIFFLFNQLGSIGQCRENSLLSEPGKVIFHNLIWCNSSSKQIKDLPDHYPSSFESGLSMAYFAVNNNIIINFNSHGEANNNNELFKFFGLKNKNKWIKVKHLQPGMEIAVPDGDTIKWDEIISIEYAGEEQVYDIEVDGTHNFIANGIVAHNTYIGGNVGIGTTGPSGILGSQLHVYDASSDSAIILERGSPASKWEIAAGGFSANGDFTIYESTAGHTGYRFLIQQDGNVGIGTTSPTSKLHVDGNTNITGLCVAEDSLITLADNSKKKITEIKPGDYVKSLDEETGRIVSNKVKALLDMDVKPVFNLTTKSGRSIKTTGNHPYLTPEGWVKATELKNGDEIAVPYILSSISLGDKTSTGDNSLSVLSPENIGQSNFNANAKYCTSFKCLGKSSLAFAKQSSNCGLGINVICFNTNSNVLSNTILDNFDLLNISSLCFSNSVNKNSGAINSNLSNMLLSANTSKECPLLNNEESTTLTSTTTNISDYSKYLFDKDSLILSENSSTSFSVNLDLESPFFNCVISSNLALRNLLNNIDQSMSGTCSTNPNSSGILTINSTILTSPKDNNKNNYIKLIISQPANNTGIASKESEVIWDEIISIEYAGEERVYDLMIENTHNFIANDIIAHNTYLNNTLNVINGNVGIGTSSPQTELHVIGSANITGTVYAHNFSGNSNISFLNANGDEIVRFTDAGRVGIGTLTPNEKLTVVGNVNITENLTISGKITGEHKQELEVESIGDVEAGKGMVLLMHFNNDSSVGECYDNETEILTRAKCNSTSNCLNYEWKYFKNLDKTEEVATLNPETNEIEWNKPYRYQTYEHDDFMYRIETEEGDLVVSPEHKVYSSIEKNDLVSFVMMGKVFKNKSISFNAKNQYKASDMHSFEMAHVPFEILNMRDGNNIHHSELHNLLLQSNKQNRILAPELLHNLFDICDVNSHNDSHHLSNSSTVIALPEGILSIFFNFSTYSGFIGNSSTGCQSIFSQNSSSSLDNSLLLMNSSNILLLLDSSLATSDQFTHGKRSNLSLNLSSIGVIKLAIYNTSKFFEEALRNSFKISGVPEKPLVFLSMPEIFSFQSTPLACNFSNNSSLFLIPSFMTSGQLMSGCLSNFSLNSLDTDTVNLFIFNTSEFTRMVQKSKIFDTPHNCSSKHKCVDVYKPFEIENTKKFRRNFWCARNLSISEHFEDPQKPLVSGMPKTQSVFKHAKNAKHFSAPFGFENDLNQFSLQPITEAYSDFIDGKDIYFLNSENKPIKIKKITKEKYNGKIYDVTVDNHIILVRRNDLIVWSGNSYDDSGAANSTVYDYSDMQNNGTFYDNGTNTGGYKPNGGMFSGAYEFDGVDDYVKFADSDDWISGTKDLTYSFWVKWNAFVEYDALYSHYVDGSNRVEINFYKPGNILRFEAYPSPGAVIEDWSWTPATDIWYYVAITRTGSSITAYVDGKSIGTDTSNPTISDISASLYIGANGAGSNHFNGTIDEVAIYNRSLSAEEILENYKKGFKNVIEGSTVFSDETRIKDNLIVQGNLSGDGNLIINPGGGNVGIGTTSPGAKLQVDVSTDYDGMVLKNENNYKVAKIARGTDTAGYFSLYGTTDNTLVTLSAVAGANSYINTGNVGIGTTGPGTKLHIRETTAGIGPQLTIDGNWTADTHYGSVLFSNNADSIAGILGQRDGANDAGALALYTQKTGEGLSERVRITSTGNVGIGVTNPATRLDVFVDGTSGSEETALSLGNDDFTAGMLTNLRWQHGDGTGSERTAAIIKVEQTDATHGKMHFFIDNAGVSNVMTLYNGNVGIGTTGPGRPLEVNNVGTADGDHGISVLTPNMANGNHAGTIWFGKTLTDANSGFISFVPSATTALNSVRIGVNEANDLLNIQQNGNVGIGTTNPNEGKVEVKGGTVCVDTNSDDSATSCIAAESDIRLKTNVKTIDNALDKITKIRGVEFDWRWNDTNISENYPLITRFKNKPHSVGIISQELEEVFPEAIMQETIGDENYQQIDYGLLAAPLIEAVKELNINVKENNEEISQLKEENQKLKAEIEALKSQK